MSEYDYWEQCIMEAAEDCGANLTQQQVETIASWVKGCHENYGLAHYTPSASDHYQQEIDRIKREHRAEEMRIAKERRLDRERYEDTIRDWRRANWELRNELERTRELAGR